MVKTGAGASDSGAGDAGAGDYECIKCDKQLTGVFTKFCIYISKHYLHMSWIIEETDVTKQSVALVRRFSAQRHSDLPRLPIPLLYVVF